MEFIIKPRGTGKTRDLIKIALQNNTPILTGANKEHYEVLCRKMNCPTPVIFTVYDLKKGKHRGNNYDKTLVDDIDLVLKQLLSDYELVPTLGTMTIGDI